MNFFFRVLLFSSLFFLCKPFFIEFIHAGVSEKRVLKKRIKKSDQKNLPAGLKAQREQKKKLKKRGTNGAVALVGSLLAQAKNGGEKKQLKKNQKNQFMPSPLKSSSVKSSEISNEEEIYNQQTKRYINHIIEIFLTPLIEYGGILEYISAYFLPLVKKRISKKAEETVQILGIISKKIEADFFKEYFDLFITDPSYQKEVLDKYDEFSEYSAMPFRGEPPYKIFFSKDIKYDLEVFRNDFEDENQFNELRNKDGAKKVHELSENIKSDSIVMMGSEEGGILNFFSRQKKYRILVQNNINNKEAQLEKSEMTPLLNAATSCLSLKTIFNAYTFALLCENNYVSEKDLAELVGSSFILKNKKEKEEAIKKFKIVITKHIPILFEAISKILLASGPFLDFAKKEYSVKEIIANYDSFSKKLQKNQTSKLVSFFSDNAQTVLFGGAAVLAAAVGTYFGNKSSDGFKSADFADLLFSTPKSFIWSAVATTLGSFIGVGPLLAVMPFAQNPVMRLGYGFVSTIAIKHTTGFMSEKFSSLMKLLSFDLASQDQTFATALFANVKKGGGAEVFFTIPFIYYPHSLTNNLFLTKIIRKYTKFSDNFVELFTLRKKTAAHFFEEKIVANLPSQNDRKLILNS